MAFVKAPSKLVEFIERFQKISLSQKIFFVQQLGVMVKTGISMSVALRTLAEQTSSKKFKKILTDLQQGVEKGNLLSQGLEKYQKTFGELFINMVRVGETSGKLEDVLKQLFVQMKKDHDIIAKVRGAMIYPTIVIVMMIAIVILMLLYVIPTISTVFKEINVPLPLATRVMIGISDFMVKDGLYVLIFIVALAFGFSAVMKSPKGHYRVHKVILHLPIAGKIIKKINLARFCRTISSLLKTDIPIVQSFEITSRILGNLLYREALLEAREKIKKGISIEESLRPHSDFFPPVVLQMIAVGEETGTLDEILEESAVFYEEDVNQTMTELPTIIEPLLMVILGVGVAGIAVAVIMPMYSLTQEI